MFIWWSTFSFLRVMRNLWAFFEHGTARSPTSILATADTTVSTSEVYTQSVVV